MRQGITRLQFDRETGKVIGPLCTLGQKLYYPDWVYSSDIVIPVYVTEINDVYANPERPNDPAVWVQTTINNSRIAEQVAVDEDDKFVIVSRNVDLVVANYKHVNQFLWIDEVIGNSVQLGDEVFLTVQEALQFIRPSNKKNLKERLRNFRKRRMNFVNWTHVSQGYPGIVWPERPEKKVYVRRG